MSPRSFFRGRVGGMLAGAFVIAVLGPLPAHCQLFVDPSRRLAIRPYARPYIATRDQHDLAVTSRTDVQFH